MTTTETSGSGDVSRSLELLWGTGDRPSRGPKPGLTLDRIVTAAVEVADAEGLAAVSMRRISTDLGTGTMSLYRYVPGKAELLDLMLDRVQGAPLDAEKPAPGGDWRAAVESLARGHLDLYRAHPWLLKVNQARTVLGPSALRGLELALSGLQGMGLSDPELISVIISVQSFVSGIARMEIQAVEAVQETGLSDEEFWGGQQPFLEKAMESGEYPLMAALSEDTFGAGFDHFGFGLRRLIDGLDVLVRQRTAG
ncbi:TetR/AcrR family transcriptional regulator [Streptomyces lunaelactis]|uniref:TetR/AcrR family transcriptional regulator n=1 Tax=Streptomyces lunaelactis TaxID=1535768 RepID=UPI001584D2DE|nr:TetR/AcrR family transcriptional regulator [Streptomyces lunaelactis]NUK09861.1 TetR/AcrR family transcriptional regulator [Streptomyces lunaelactis]NUK23950.1 TetR/AcrR family transcriptional regulator [Streptomyces lunaelactis]NUK36202.1 TetR/AcrR family transcriptional regulator [Streptomyces lunaelactis]NUK42777.1 TetR/AcrR family transcriptional regulator [Streptomyces lunaelactis]NUK73819.1 TetR/AcrR family transcriptional regulator [Streptomyces lunaelactis]